jgi:hypothetical protein
VVGGSQQEDGGHSEVAPVVAGLALADAEYLGSALRADALDRRTLVLQGDLLWTLDLNLLLTLHAVCLCHSPDPPLYNNICADAITYLSVCQYPPAKFLTRSATERRKSPLIPDHDYAT